jgi:hypothetical protein
MTMLGKGALPDPMGTLVQSCCKAGKRRMQMNFAEILGDAAKRSGPPVHVLLLERNDLLFAMPFPLHRLVPSLRFQFASDQFKRAMSHRQMLSAQRADT